MYHLSLVQVHKRTILTQNGKLQGVWAEEYEKLESAKAADQKPSLPRSYKKTLFVRPWQAAPWTRCPEKERGLSAAKRLRANPTFRFINPPWNFPALILTGSVEKSLSVLHVKKP